jgi:REP element-mobilizing transposase RayT
MITNELSQEMGRRGRSQFGKEGHTFFVTTTVVEFARIFSCGTVYYDILVGSLRHVLHEHRAPLLAYVLMPSHVHLIPAMPAGESISDLMRDFKKYTSTTIREQLQRERREAFLETLHRNGKLKKHQEFKLWMDRFDDNVIRDDKTLATKIEYIHNNPVKAGFVSTPEDWIYSSAADYLGIRRGPLTVTTDWSRL